MAKQTSPTIKTKTTSTKAATVTTAPAATKPKITRKFLAIYLIVVILLVQFAFIAILISKQRQTDKHVSVLVNALIVQSAKNATSASYATQSRAVVSVTDNAVYLPELHLKLPLNSNTIGLFYNVRGTTMPGEAQSVTDVTTQTLANEDPGTVRSIACIPLRLAFETKSNPYNSREKDIATVKLADGRTLHTYAFHHPQCDQLFKFSGTNPDALGKLFEQAESY